MGELELWEGWLGLNEGMGDNMRCWEGAKRDFDWYSRHVPLSCVMGS